MPSEPRDSDRVSWGSAPPFSLGVEEELFLVDAVTLEPAPLYEQVVSEKSERFKPEVFACLVETTTPVRPDADALLADLVGLRRSVAERARIVAAGMHPFARGEDQAVVPLPRYERMQRELGPRLSSQLVCGLHVHVSIPDEGAALRAFEGVVPWLPTLLALSANSPFAEGVATGLRSTRAERLLLMPTGGTPPPLPDWSAWEQATAGEEARRHWDAWPRPEYGTLEVRVLDQQTDVRRSAGFAGIVQGLVRAVVDAESSLYDRELYALRRQEASRSAPDPAEVEALAELVLPGELASHVLFGRPEAERQLELGPEQALRHLAVASRP